MRLFAVGVSHRTAPVELRETVDFARRGLPVAIEALRERQLAREAVVLSTCNRAEIYAGADSDAAADSCARFIGEFNGLDWSAIEPPPVVYRGPAAASHLFRGAAGRPPAVLCRPASLAPATEWRTAAA